MASLPSPSEPLPIIALVGKQSVQIYRLSRLRVEFGGNRFFLSLFFFSFFFLRVELNQQRESMNSLLILPMSASRYPADPTNIYRGSELYSNSDSIMVVGIGDDCIDSLSRARVSSDCL
jgi:hypothetical protein